MTTVAVFSGGLDSTVLAYHLQASGDRVLALSIDYGQRHRRELESAQRIAAQMEMPWLCADLSALRPLLAGSSQTDDAIPVPDGHYEAESMKATVVPNRNMLLLATAGAYAVSQRADALAYAAHAGDHAIYPDCRPEFADAMAKALHLCDWHDLLLLTPFVRMTKTDIVRRGASLGVPFALTYSCYRGGVEHCGTCGTCAERREAFKEAGIDDPTTYLR